MKIFPGQSQCPYCKTIYRYGDLKKLTYKKSGTCYHCKRSFKVSRKSFLFLLLWLFVIYIAVNAFSIALIKSLSFVLLFIINLIPTVTAVLILPLFICLDKDEKSK